MKWMNLGLVSVLVALLSLAAPSAATTYVGAGSFTLGVGDSVTFGGGYTAELTELYGTSEAGSERASIKVTLFESAFEQTHVLSAGSSVRLAPALSAYMTADEIFPGAYGQPAQLKARVYFESEPTPAPVPTPNATASPIPTPTAIPTTSPPCLASASGDGTYTFCISSYVQANNGYYVKLIDVSSGGGEGSPQQAMFVVYDKNWNQVSVLTVNEGMGVSDTATGVSVEVLDISGSTASDARVKAKVSSYAVPTATAVPTSGPGPNAYRCTDTNNDGEMNLIDLQFLAAHLDTRIGEMGYDARADFNGDGYIDSIDQAIMTYYYYKPLSENYYCRMAGYAYASRCPDLNADGTVNLIDLQKFGTAYGKCSSDSGYDYRMDFDGDGCVTDVDKEILSKPFNNPSLYSRFCAATPTSTPTTCLKQAYGDGTYTLCVGSVVQTNIGYNVKLEDISGYGASGEAAKANFGIYDKGMAKVGQLANVVEGVSRVDLQTGVSVYINSIFPGAFAQDAKVNALIQGGARQPDVPGLCPDGSKGEFVKRGPNGGYYWQSLGTDTSAHPEIARYRILWFAGQWSPWYVPGQGDLDWKINSRRVWSYFDDHTHEYLQCGVAKPVPSGFSISPAVNVRYDGSVEFMAKVFDERGNPVKDARVYVTYYPSIVYTAETIAATPVAAGTVTSSGSGGSGGGGKGTPVKTSSAKALYFADKLPTVQITEYADFQCPFCQRVQATLEEVKKYYSGRADIAIDFKHYPLPFHGNAQKAAEAAECARDQGKFWEMHDKLFDNQDDLGLASLKKYARDLGLNADAFDSCLDSSVKAQVVKADYDEGVKLGVTGVPYFFIGSQSIVGAQSFDAFQKAIDSVLAGQPASSGGGFGGGAAVRTNVVAVAEPVQAIALPAVAGGGSGAGGFTVPRPIPMPVPPKYSANTVELKYDGGVWKGYAYGLSGYYYAEFTAKTSYSYASASTSFYVAGEEPPIPPLPYDGEEFTLKLQPGWNMISVPLTGAIYRAIAKKVILPVEAVQEAPASISSSTGALVAAAGGSGGGSGSGGFAVAKRPSLDGAVVVETDCPVATLWYYDSQQRRYTNEGKLREGEVVQAGKGYWVRVKGGEACKVVVRGESDYYLDGKELWRGWNQVGGPRKAVRLEEAKGTCGIRSAWQWDNSAKKYERAGVLQPGVGYFIKVEDDCVLGSRYYPAEEDVPPLPED